MLEMIYQFNLDIPPRLLLQLLEVQLHALDVSHVNQLSTRIPAVSHHPRGAGRGGGRDGVLHQPGRPPRACPLLDPGRRFVPGCHPGGEGPRAVARQDSPVSQTRVSIASR